jgi:uncharacterized membrane-anchored protein
MAGEFGRRRKAGTDGSGSQVQAGAQPGTTPPARTRSLQEWLRLGAQLAAAGLIGFGIMLWVAAHWDDISRFGRFALVGGALAVALLVSLVNAVRTPGLIVAFLATGGLFALIGQTYQTGADPWQLFAVWAAVGVPWALAARSDVLWLVWTIVVFVAIALWVATFASPLGWHIDRTPILIGWLLSGALTVLLSPHAQLQPWLGDTRWSFRIAALLTVAAITQGGVTELLMARDAPVLYWLALLVLGGFALTLAGGAVLDLALASVLGLALNTLLITGFGKLVLKSSSATFVSLLLIGLAGAALVAGTGALTLHLARERAGGGPGLAALKGREWPVILMTGVGALLTTIPLAGALSVLLGPFLMKGPGPYVFGAGLLAGSAVAIRSQEQTSFWHQLAAVGLTLGFCLVAFGITRDAGRSVAVTSALLGLLATGMALAVGRSWTAGLLGAAAGVFLAIFVNALFAPPWFPGSVTPNAFHALGWTIALAAAATALLWRPATGAAVPRVGLPSASLDEAWSRFIGGAVAAGLLGTVATAGPTFLLSGAFGGLGVGLRGHAVQAMQLSWQSLSPVSGLLALAGCAILLASRPMLQTALGGGAALIAIVLSGVIGSLGAPIFVVCVAMTTGRRSLGIGAAIAALWVIGSFYYWLGWPLAEKAALMLAAGVTLAILCLMAGVRRPSLGAGGGTPAPALAARGLIVAGALAAGGLAGQSVRANEAIIANGREIHLALAPVDPRSLVQGDFMRLRFAMPQAARSERGTPLLGTRKWAVAHVDARNVATIDEILSDAPASVPAGKLVLAMRLKDRQWVIGTDAWFFREGTAKTWQAARFGTFRVAPDGTALLVGLADKDLVPIR